jgi:hypothetical protein
MLAHSLGVFYQVSSFRFQVSSFKFQAQGVGFEKKQEEDLILFHFGLGREYFQGGYNARHSSVRRDEEITVKRGM